MDMKVYAFSKVAEMVVAVVVVVVVVVEVVSSIL
jgi:hypothetical protein